MSDSKVLDISEIQISSFVVPTADDIKLFKSLTPEQQRALIDREIQKGEIGDISSMTIDEIWAEALRRAEAKSNGPNAL